VASDVLEHIEDDLAAVSEIARVLRPGGAAIISVPAHQWLFSEHDAALHHFRRYSKARLRDVLERGGFRIRRISYWNAALFPAICLHRLLVKLRRGHEPRSDIRSSPWPINQALAALLAVEAAILRHAPLPWGVSLVGVAERV
jgi:SAM-dependent methyltransferase